MADRPVPAAREIPEEVFTAALAARRDELPTHELVERAFEAASPAFLARLLVGALGGEEAVVERMARAAHPGIWGRHPDWEVRRDQHQTLAEQQRALRSLMEDHLDG